MVRIQKEPFDVGAELNALIDSSGVDGAAVTFTGYVRGGNDKDQTSRMTLEHYPAMAQKELEAIEAKAHDRWTLNKSLIIHRYGDLYPGDPIVLVVTTSAHRAEAFAAAEFLMDWLKTKAPFWKREEVGGDAQWVEAKDSDDEAAARWNEK